MLKISPKLSRHFKGFCSSPEIIMLFVYMKCRFSLSYRDLEEIMMIRGATIDHSTLQRWVRRFACLIDQRVRKRKRPVNNSWRMDETYIRLNGKWIYLYRAVDKYGDTIDFLLRARRDGTAAKAFFRKAFKGNGIPEKVTVDKSGSNKCALDYFNENLEEDDQFEIRQIKYLNNIVEQDHRFVKKRTKPMLGFKNFYSAKETISGIENVRIIQKGQIIGQRPNQSAYTNFAELMA
jgi:putative transposase